MPRPWPWMQSLSVNHIRVLPISTTRSRSIAGETTVRASSATEPAEPRDGGEGAEEEDEEDEDEDGPGVDEG